MVGRGCVRLRGYFCFALRISSTNLTVSISICLRSSLSKYFFESSIRRGILDLFSLLLFFSRTMKIFLQLRSLSFFTRIRAV